MKWIGAHVSASGGVSRAPENAKRIGANAFALFVKNQKQWQAAPLSDEEIQSFREACEKYEYTADQILPHAGYLINPANPDQVKRKKSLESLVQEMKRCRALGLNRLNLHPGSHLGLVGEEEAVKLVAETLDLALEQVDGIQLVLENTAGQGNGIGSGMETIQNILESMKHADRAGFCLDTCHAFSAGYDLVSEEGYRSFVKTIEKTVGFRRLLGVHMNDSRTPFGSKKDRHESLGKGTLGWAPFERIMNDNIFDKTPLILETVDEELWPEEILALRKLEKLEKSGKRKHK